MAKQLVVKSRLQMTACPVCKVAKSRKVLLWHSLSQMQGCQITQEGNKV